MGTSSRLMLLLLAAGTARAQYDNQPPPDPNMQQDPNQDPYGQPQAYPQQQYQQQDPYAQQDPNYQYQQQPQQYEYAYMGAHPIPYDQGGGYCYQTAAHYHPYAPFDQYLFRESGGYWYFVGDPADFGYSQQMWGYSGNHPIPTGWGGGYCYINWAHRHPYPPPSTIYFNYVGGYYVYNGPWDPIYWRWRDRYAGYYGNYYRNNYYGGRYWTVRPPHVYRPSFGVGAPGVRVVPGRAGVVVGPPPGRGGVVVGAPPARPYGAPGVRVVTPPPARGYAPAPARPVAPARPYTPPPPPRPATHVAPAPAHHR